MTTRLFPLAAALTASLALAGAAHAGEATLDTVLTLPEQEVSTTRVGERAPFARASLTRRDLVAKNWGQDTPMALATLPGAYAYSDAGNGIGYSYLAIRGFPQRRISVLVNGVPLNDPESHEVYWIDHPDLLASTSSVEVQRGVGSALYGAASLGGSVHVETSPFTADPHASASVSYGSFDTKRLVLEQSSGRLPGGFDLYGRYSRIETLGYRDQSWSKLWSYALSARKETGAQSFRVTLYGGPEETHLAYLGVPRSTLDGAITGDPDRDRRFNPITYANERDHFFEPHYELLHTWSPRTGLALSQTFFWFDGKGFYDERRAGRALADYRLLDIVTADSTLAPRDYYAQNPDGSLAEDSGGRFTIERFDLVRRRTVVNRHFGWVPRARIDHPGGALTVGGELRAHDGRHFGEVIAGAPLPFGTAPNHAYYDYHPRTLAAGLFVREEWNAAPALLVTGDLAWRHQSYAMRDDRFDGIRFDQPYDFGLPRLGLTWTPRRDVSAFASWSNARREPAFRDLYDAEGPGSVPLYRVRDLANNVYADPLVRPERVNAWEAGASWRRGEPGGAGAALNASANLYRMDFRDELVYAGQYDTDLGYPILGNAAASVHQGVELAARGAWPLARGASFALDANASLADNHFVEYRERYGPTAADEVSYDGNALAYFPDRLANVAGTLAWRAFALGASVQHAGRIWLDNSESRPVSIAPRTTLDLTASARTRVAGSAAELTLRVFNALDARYETGGYYDFDLLEPVFTPAATRNWLLGARVEF